MSIFIIHNPPCAARTILAARLFHNPDNPCFPAHLASASTIGLPAPPPSPPAAFCPGLNNLPDLRASLCAPLMLPVLACPPRPLSFPPPPRPLCTAEDSR